MFRILANRIVNNLLLQVKFQAHMMGDFVVINISMTRSLSSITFRIKKSTWNRLFKKFTEINDIVNQKDIK